MTAPADNSTVTAPTDIIGTVQDANLVSFTLAVAPFGSDAFTTFFTGTSQVTNGVLGTFDPTMLQNDTYTLRLAATNTGGLSSIVDSTVNVADNLKLGNFRLSLHRPDDPRVRYPDHGDTNLRHAHRQSIGRLWFRLDPGIPRRGSAHQRRPHGR